MRLMAVAFLCAPLQLAVIASGRAADWTPAYLGGSLALWLDAADAGTISLNGSTVSQWNDKSGKARNVTQATAANQPAYLQTALNGKPSINFVGSQRLLRTTGEIPAQISVFAVVGPSSGTAEYGTLFRTDAYPTAATASHFLGYRLVSGSPSLATLFGSSQTSWNSISGNTPVFQLSGNAIVGFVHAGGTGYPFANGVAQDMKNASGTPTSTGFVVGNSGQNDGLPWMGSISEIVMTFSALSTFDRQKLEGYLAWKWGMQGDLPSGHPYKDAQPQVFLSIETSATLVDTNSNDRADAGDRIDYAFTLGNTTSLTQSNIAVTDSLPGMTITGSPLASLAPGATDTSVSGSYTITQADVDAGLVESRATATSSSPDGTNDVSALSDDDNGATDANNDGDSLNDPTTVLIPADPQLSVVKTFILLTDANGDGKAGAGDVIRYSYAVSNTGNLAVTDISATDTTNGLDPAFLTGANPGQPTIVSLTDDAGTQGDSTDADNAGPVWDVLAPGDTITFTADYTVRQADVDTLQ